MKTPGKINFEEISSSNNLKFKSWSELLESSGIKKQRSFIASGSKIVNEYLSKRDLQPIALLIKKDHLESQERLLEQALHRNVKVYLLKSELFKELDCLGTHEPLLVLPTQELKELNLQSSPQGLEVILPFNNPLNIGAGIRSARAFNADKIILTEESASPFLPKALRASAGCALGAPLYKSGPLVELAKRSRNLVIFDLNGKSLDKFAWPQNVRILIGEEGRGTPSLEHALSVNIPISTEVESLNANVTAAIAFYSYRQKFSRD